MSFVIKQDTTNRIVAGAFKSETFFYVQDDTTGQLVGKKAHGTQEAAELELVGMGGLVAGLEFARAQFPKLGDKAHVGKANVIADYLAWEAAGRPVKSLEEAETAETAETEQPAPEAEEVF